MADVRVEMDEVEQQQQRPRLDLVEDVGEWRRRQVMMMMVVVEKVTHMLNMMMMMIDQLELLSWMC